MVKGNQKAEGEHIALVRGTLINGTGKDPLEGSVVVTRGAIIEEIGKQEEVKLPDECWVIDVSGKTIILGMIDLHVHLFIGGDDPAMPAGVALPTWVNRSLPLLGKGPLPMQGDR